MLIGYKKQVCRVLAAAMLAPSAWSAQPGFFEANVMPGTDRSYLTFDLFAPLTSTDTSGLFIDARLNLSDLERHSGSVGLAWRWLSPSADSLIGVYGYADRQRTPSDNHFNQATLGVEGYGSQWDWRLNAYLPWTDVQATDRGNQQAGSGFDLVGNWVLAPGSIQTQNYERALQGFDAELGSRIPGLEQLRVYVGGYYYDAPDISAFTGVQGRVQWDISERYTLGLTGRHDEFRGGEAFVEFRYRIGFAGKDKSFKARKAADRFGERIVRNNEVLVSNEVAPGYTLTPAAPVLAPNGQVLNIYYVDNTATGDGTVESPFATLKEAEAASNPGDVIYVAAGDGTANGMDEGIVLQDRQYLLGAGQPLSVRDPFRPGSGVPVLLPTGGFVGAPATLIAADALPSITNSSGVGVDLANASQVSGLSIDGARVGVRAMDVSDFTISNLVVNNGDQVGGACNALDPTVCSGFNVQVAASDGALVRGEIVNLFADRGELAVLAVQAAGSGEVFLNARGLVLSNTTADPNIDVDVRENGRVSLALFDSQLSGGRDGINADPLLGQARVDLLLDTVTITGTRDDGIDMDAEQNSIASLTILNSDINNARSRALELNARNDARFDVVIDNTRLANPTRNNQDLIAFITNDQAVSSLTMTNSLLENATRRSLTINNLQSAVHSVNLSANTFAGSGNDHIYLGAIHDATVQADLTANTLLSAGAQSIELWAANNASASYTLSGNALLGSGGVMLYQRSRNNADVIFDLDANQLGNAGNRSLYIDNRGNSSAVDVSGNTLTDSGHDHIYYIARNGVTGSLNVINNELLSAGQRGINLNVVGAGISQTINLVNNRINDANSDAMLLNLRSGAQMSLNIADNEVLRAGDRSLEMNIRSNNTVLDIDLVNNLFDGSSGDHIYAQTRSGSPEINWVLTDNRLLNAGGDGFELFSRNRSANNLVLTNNTVSGSGSHGIRTRTEDNTVTGMRLVDNRVLGSTGIGVELEVRENATYTVFGQGNRIVGNSGIGIDFDQQAASATFSADFGGGGAGSTGGNLVFANGPADVRVNRTSVVAQGNWWGLVTGLPLIELQTSNGGTLDGSSFLTVEPVGP